MSDVTIPGQAGPTASGGDTPLTVEPSGNHRQGKAAKRVSFPTFLSLHPLLSQMTGCLLRVQVPTPMKSHFHTGAYKRGEKGPHKWFSKHFLLVRSNVKNNHSYSFTGCGGSAPPRPGSYLGPLCYWLGEGRQTDTRGSK